MRKQKARVAPNVVPSVVGSFQDIPLSTLNAFPVPEFRNELKIRGIDPRGLKNLALRGRLKQALADKVLIHIEPEPKEKEQPQHLRGFQSPLIGRFCSMKLHPFQSRKILVGFVRQPYQRQRHELFQSNTI
jgi:hypothetical protein